MATKAITTEDLQAFREELIADFRKLLSERQGISFNRWLKSNQVRRVLTISPGTLQHLRINGTLPFIKVGGVLYYDAQDIEKMLLDHKQVNNVFSTKNSIEHNENGK